MIFKENLGYPNDFDDHSFDPSSEEEMPIEETLCPECNGPMVSRQSKFGVFWGCKDYPKCKGTRDSMGRSKSDRDKWKEEQESKEEKPKTNRRWKIEG